MIVSEKKATQQLINVILECNGDALAALYGHVFCTNAIWNDTTDCIRVSEPGTLNPEPGT